jgi:NAD-dependent oxidoreductase involved in siderophore biosynthesis
LDARGTHLAMFGQTGHEVNTQEMRKCKELLREHPLKQQQEHNIKTSLRERGCEDVN